MGILQRYEDSDDGARRVPVKRSRGWRYDETSSSDVSDDCASQSDPSSSVSSSSSSSEILGWHSQYHGVLFVLDTSDLNDDNK